jgi:rhamnosyltransferase
LEYGERFGIAAKNFFRLIRDVDLIPFDYVALSDQDDVWLPDKLSRAISLLESTLAAGLSSDVIAFWQDGRQKTVKKSYPQKKFDYFFEAAGPGCTYCLTGLFMLEFKKFLLEHYSEIYNNASHDWILYAFARHNGYKWVIDNLPLVYYRQHLNNQTGLNSGLKAYIKRWRLLNDNWYQNRISSIVKLVDPAHESGVSMKKSFLLRNFYHLRRRPRDAFVLFLLVFFNIV